MRRFLAKPRIKEIKLIRFTSYLTKGWYKCFFSAAFLADGSDQWFQTKNKTHRDSKDIRRM